MSWGGEVEVEYHLVLVDVGVRVEGEQWWCFGRSNGVKPVLNNKGVLDWAYVGLGVCVGWVV